MDDYGDDDENGAVDVRANVARNPRTPPMILEQLMQDDEEQVWASLASNPGLPEWVMDDFASSTEYVQECLAANPSLPSRLFDQLSSAYKSGVRASLAERKDLPLDILLVLASDESETVRAQVTQNPTAPFSLREKGGDSQNTTRGTLEDPRSGTPENAEEIDLAEKLKLARGKAPLELAVQIELSLNADAQVREGLASRVSLAREILVKLATDSSEQVRRAAASNRNTPSESLESLAEDPSDYVRAAVAENLNAWDLKHLLAKDPSANVRAGVASNHLAEAELLRKLSQDPSSRVRQAVAENTRTPSEVLAVLAEEYE